MSHETYITISHNSDKNLSYEVMKGRTCFERLALSRKYLIRVDKNRH